VTTIESHRSLTFSTQDEILAEAERLAAGNPRIAGKHSFPEILRHLARTNDMLTGRIVPPKLPLPMRLMMPLVRMLVFNRPVKPGFNLPKNSESFFWPQEPIDVEEALAALQESIAHYQRQGPLPYHPIFGKASRQQIDRLALDHAAMHLGFVHID
jgi:hypothetical protein